MIDKIDAHKIQDFLAKSSSKQPGSVKAHPMGDVDISLEVNYASLIERATQTQQADAEAVRRARELLRCGQLESLENIEAAAENIVQFGV
jgi:hypothetical protein